MIKLSDDFVLEDNIVFHIGNCTNSHLIDNKAEIEWSKLAGIFGNNITLELMNDESLNFSSLDEVIAMAKTKLPVDYTLDCQTCGAILPKEIHEKAKLLGSYL